ncbi:hypothetical protein EZV62_025030 [Acer yangbiense]|uniref:NADH dehydrogenase [ubiquinone] 1 alpha subcomplex subunit 6 n=1 Tax=Acer yangbiense TaxID=1000413 RepID=A0A5C7GXF0_9ROSI|nr:hypothetical protein EZV62_025030 [Acer yangbiense]
MSFTLRSVKVPPNSVNLEEARSRMFEFFRLACRSIPSIIDIYNLDEVVTKSQLRTTIAAQIRKNSQVTNPKVSFHFLFVFIFLIVIILQVIDMLLFKGMEELNNILEHAKQRHHMIGQYVTGQHGLVQDLDSKDQGMSDFLKNFYNTNYF